MESSWASHVLAVLFSAATMAAILKGAEKLQRNKYVKDRQTRKDEVEVLHGEIERKCKEVERLDKTIEDIKLVHSRELGEKDKELRELKSTHTAALLKKAGLEVREEYILEQNLLLRDQNNLLKERCDKLDQEIEMLKEARRGEDSAG